MIDKKKLKDVMKKQDLKQEKPTDPSMTLDVKNEDVEAQIDLYLKEKTGENLNALIELMRTRRVLVPANLNDEKKPVRKTECFFQFIQVKRRFRNLRGVKQL